VDAVLFGTSEIIPSTNLRYLTGFTGSDASVLITRSARHLFTDGRYRFQARRETSEMTVHVVRRKFDALARYIKREGVQRLGIESARLSHEFVTTLANRVPDVEMVPLSRRFLEGLRIRKGPEEKKKLAKAAETASGSCRELLDSPLSGRVESAVAAELEGLFRSKGAEGIAFDTITASGERSALPHGKASNKVIEPGDLIVIDFGCRWEGYNSDETVTCVVGKPVSDQVRIHAAVYDAHMRAVDSLRPGCSVKEVDRVARKTIDDAGYGKYFMHGLGHGVGLEIHEPPFLSPLGRGKLEEGMVFTIEPGVYVEGLGGVRLESLVYLGGDGPEILSRMPKDLISVD
jgi:Xaa-Pro aminopeptidase